MSDAVVLTLREEPKHALIAAAITPDRLASLGAAEIAALPVVHGGRAAQLGDFFKVKGERSATIRIEGELAHVEGIGTGMAAGEIVVAGGVGRDLGVQMAGGRIDVHGDAGDNAGGAGPGASRGIRIMLCCRYVGADGSLTPIKMMSSQSGSRMPEVYHLRPSTT